MTKDEILTALPKFSNPDLEAIIAVASSLLQAPRGAFSGNPDNLPALMFEALSGPSNGFVSYATVALTKSGKLLVTKAPSVTKFFNKHFKGWDDTKILQLAFMRMMFELLADDLKERNVQPTFGIMVANLNRLGEVFDSAFPNYLSSGMGPLVLKTLTTPRVA